MDFRGDGPLVYTIRAHKDQIILMPYRIDGSTIITY